MVSASNMSGGLMLARQQQTLSASTIVSGRGYWSGKEITVQFEPAEDDAGVVFVRSDLDGQPEIPAYVENRIEIPRRTNLVQGSASVEMVEHVLAALAGLQIDNCRVIVDSAEMPGMDGSCLAYVDAIRSVGVTVQSAPRGILQVSDVVRVGDEECWVEARPASNGKLNFKYRLDFGRDNMIGRETLEHHVSPEYFETELASARTFLLLEEAEWLRSQGLGTHVDFSELLVFGPDGPIDNSLRFENECVRHKVLDLVGDLALSGCDIHGTVIANRSGHRLNAELVKQLLKENQILHHSRCSA